MTLRARAALSVLAFFAAVVPATAADDGPPAATVDPAIARIVASVSSARLRADDTRLVGFGTRNLFSTDSTDPHRGVFRARDWLVAQFRAIARASHGAMNVSLDTYEQAKTERTPRAVEVSSVIATLQGSDPARGTIVISSHYDSRNSDGNDATLDAPGADDNGSGTIAVLEAARALAATKPLATVVFACFDGEEQGLFGSDHFAKVLKAAGTVVEANLNNDIIGASVGHDGVARPNDARLFSEALPAGTSPRRTNLIGSENDSPSRELARFAKMVDAAYVPAMNLNLVWRADRFLRGGDQESFQDQGFAAVRYVEQSENFDHQHQTIRVENGLQYGDLLTYVDFDYVARVVQLNLAALATLAAAPAQPQAELLNRDLGYAAQLRWKPVAGATHYAVYWRATTEPVWTHARDVGDATSVTMTGLSKDDWIFGVSAIDAAGHASVAAYPAPVR